MDNSSQYSRDGIKSDHPSTETLEDSTTYAKEPAANPKAVTLSELELIPNTLCGPGQQASKLHKNLQRCKLEFVQQPRQARASSMSLTDRRPIQPPPIIQILDLNFYEASSLVLVSSLWTVDGEGTSNVTYGKRNKRSATRQDTSSSSETLQNLIHSPLLDVLNTQVLMGDLTAIPTTYTDLANTLGLYFVFSNLCVRLSGMYCLQFDLYDVQENQQEQKSQPLFTMRSNPFHVFNPGEYPGMMPTTALTRCFVRQGLRTRVRGAEGRHEEDLDSV